MVSSFLPRSSLIRGAILFFETHATSVDNEQGIASGWHDAELSTSGCTQAVELGGRYAREDLAAVLCSDLQRSYRTAEIAFGERGLPLLRDARLRECDYGAWTRRPRDQVDAERVRHITEPFPGGESYTQVAARTRDLLNDVLRDWAGRRVMIVGHRGTWYSLEHVVKGKPLADAVAAPWIWQPGWVYSIAR
ncbi:MAG TPA: histidine phosphatase family protein [bacterium]|nr:histidine phosphatase family protein [bacterium]